MDWLAVLEARIARWMAYADHCARAEVDLPICRGFWTTVAVLMTVVCVVMLVYGLYAYRRPKTESNAGELPPKF